MTKLEDLKGAISAEEARQIARNYVDPDIEKSLEPIFDNIRKQSSIGLTSFTWSEEMIAEKARSISRVLKSLGYKVEYDIEERHYYNSGVGGDPLGPLEKTVYRVSKLKISWEGSTSC